MTAADMQPIIEQEKYFFELTKLVMSEKEVGGVNFSQMSSTTKKAFEFMRKTFSKQEERLIQLYFQTCKIELLVLFVVKKNHKKSPHIY